MFKECPECNKNISFYSFVKNCKFDKENKKLHLNVLCKNCGEILIGSNFNKAFLVSILVKYIFISMSAFVWWYFFNFDLTLGAIFLIPILIAIYFVFMASLYSFIDFEKKRDKSKNSIKHQHHQ